MAIVSAALGPFYRILVPAILAFVYNVLYLAGEPLHCAGDMVEKRVSRIPQPSGRASEIEPSLTAASSGTPLSST